MQTTLGSSFFVTLLCIFFACGDQTAPTDTAETISPAPTEVPAPRPAPRPAPTDLAVDEPSDEAPTPAVISDIREEYQRIESLLSANKLREVNEEITCKQEDGNLNLTRYYEGEEVVMIKTITGIGHAFVTTRIYLAEGQPFFVYEEDESFGFGAGTNADGSTGTVTDMKETRLYIEDGRIIRKLEKSFEERSWENDPSSAEIPNKLQESAAGKEYPKAAVVPDMISGKIGC